MNDRKRTIVTLWAGTTILLVLFFFLPQKADNYFLSLRVLNRENAAVEAGAAAQKDAFRFFRNDKDDARVLNMLGLRVRDDGRRLFIHVWAIIFVLNALACFLYIFNMRVPVIAAWMAAYLLVTGVLVLQSYISLRPY